MRAKTLHSLTEHSHCPVESRRPKNQLERGSRLQENKLNLGPGMPRQNQAQKNDGDETTSGHGWAGEFQVLRLLGWGSPGSRPAQRGGKGEAKIGSCMHGQGSKRIDEVRFCPTWQPDLRSRSPAGDVTLARGEIRRTRLSLQVS